MERGREFHVPTTLLKKEYLKALVLAYLMIFRVSKQIAFSFICNVEKIMWPKWSIRTTNHFTCTSANAIILHDVEKDDKNVSKPVTRHLNLPNHSTQYKAVCGLSLHQGSTENRKTWEKNLFFKLALLNLTVSTNAFHSTNLFFCFSPYHAPTNSVALSFCMQTTQNPQLVNSLWPRANAWNVSFRISLPWPIHIINSVDKFERSRERLVKPA